MHGTAHALIRLALPLLPAVLLAAGCSRQHFRDRADKDVAGTITQKNIFPDWKVENWHVYPDPRARFADPSNPDHPPYPPDDYAAWLLSPNPQKPHKHYGVGRFEGGEYLKTIEAWDAENRAEDAADAAATKDADKPAPPTPAEAAAAAAASSAGYVTALKVDEKPFQIKLEQAVELSLFNSREYQDRREDLYLAALPVTLERFGFAAQAFASETAVREWVGGDRTDAGSRWNLGTEAGLTRTLPTGGSLLFRFANQAVFDLTSGRPDISVSNMTFTFLQPLLRGAGYAVTLEALTQVERTLLYAIRSYARFRKVFFVAIAGQGDYTNNPYGLQGLSPNLGRGIGTNLNAPRAGYMPTLLQASTLANQRKNIAALESFLRLYQNLKEGGGVGELQVTRVEQQLLRSRSQLLTSTRTYLDQLDNFKLQLGVPTTLPLELDDTPLRPMRLQVQKFERVYAQLAALAESASKFDSAETPAQVRERWRRLLTESSLAAGTPLAKEYPGRAAALAALPPDALARRVLDLNTQRQKLLDLRAERQLANKEDTDADLRALEAVESAIDEARFEQALRAYDARPWLRFPRERQVGEQANAFRQVSDAGLLVAIRARNQRLDTIRADWPDLPPITVDGVEVLKVPLDEAYTKVGQTALSNRFDLMNARAQVVDSYRQIAVTANALQGSFDVRYDLETATPFGDNEPFSFSGGRGRHALTLRYDPPLVRRQERNLYRASLISYQRQRRTLMAFEDNILTDTRSDLRQVRALAETYRIQQRAVELAYGQVDNARSTLLAPPDPAAANRGGSAGDVAALTQQLLDAQNTLLQAQNDLYTAWITYQTVRMELALDLELLPLDPRGVWTNEFSQQCPAPADPRQPGPFTPGGERAPRAGGEQPPAPQPAEPGR